MPTTYRLTIPRMNGDRVRLIQRALRVKVDGVYGPETASHVAAWKYRAGYPLAAVNNAIGPRGQGYLLGDKKIPPAYRARARRRAKAGYRDGFGRPAYEAGAMRSAATDTMESWARMGLKEVPAGSNVVPRLSSIAEAYNVHDSFDEMGFPWCAYVVFLAALVNGGKTARAGMVDWRFNPLYVPEILSQAEQGKHGLLVVAKANVRRGDLAIFNYDGGVPDHIGRVVQRYRDGSWLMVEGNTSPDDRGSQSNGGGMYLRHRSDSLIQAIVRDH